MDSMMLLTGLEEILINPYQCLTDIYYPDTEYINTDDSQDSPNSTTSSLSFFIDKEYQDYPLRDNDLVGEEIDICIPFPDIVIAPAPTTMLVQDKDEDFTEKIPQIEEEHIVCDIKLNRSCTVRKARGVTKKRKATRVISILPGEQYECSIVDCSMDVKNRLQDSLRGHYLYKPKFTDKGWRKICNYHYFSDLYNHKKRKPLI